MKRIAFTSFLLISFLATYSQSNTAHFESESVVVGKNLQTQKEIKALRLTFNREVNNFITDSTSNMLFVFVDNFGNYKRLLAYDTNINSIVWTKSFNSYNESFSLNKGQLLHSKERKSFFLNVKSGEEMWESKYSMWLTDFKNQIGIGYRNSSFDLNTSSIAKGIDLKTGNVVWERDIPRNVRWERVRYLSDSILTIVSEGLHYINVKNGNGDSISDKTTLGLFQTNLSSQVLSDSLNNYWASSENLWCFDKQFNCKWKTPLDPELTGESILFKWDTSIYLINTGSSHDMYHKDKEYGKPYVAKFSAKNGTQSLFVELSTKRAILQDFQISGDTLSICFSKILTKYNLKNLSQIDTKEFELSSKERFVGFLNSSYYTKDSTQTFRELHQIDTTLQLMYNKSNTVIFINSKNEIVNSIPYKSLYRLIFKGGDFKIVRNDSYLIFIDNAGKTLLEIDEADRTKILNNKLYYARNKDLFIIDLSAMMK